MQASNGKKNVSKFVYFVVLLKCIYKVYLFKMMLVIKGRINNTTARKYRYKLFKNYHKMFFDFLV